MGLPKPPITTVTAGQPITAEGWNAIVQGLGALYDAQSCALAVTVQSGGAAVPGAVVVATTKDPNVPPAAAVPPHGGITTYLIPEMAAGVWAVHVEAPGFQPADSPDITVAPAPQPQAVTVELKRTGAAVPDLSNLKTGEALDRLTAAGFKLIEILDGNGQTLQVASLTDAQKGSAVLSQSPTGGFIADPASAAVRLVISRPAAKRGAVRIAVGPDGLPWIVDSDGQIFQRVGKSWQQRPGSALAIAIGANNGVWVLGTDSAPTGEGNVLYQWTGTGWQPQGGIGAVAIAATITVPWVVTAQTAMKRLTATGWAAVPGVFLDLAFGGPNQTIIALATTMTQGGQFQPGYQIWESTDVGSTFHQLDGGGRRIGVGRDGRPWAIDPFGRVFEREGSSWLNRGSGTDIGLGTDGSIWKVGADPVEGGFHVYQWTGARWIDPDTTVIQPHAVVVTDIGRMWHAVRSPDGGYTPWGDVTLAAAAAESFAATACAANGAELHVAGVTKSGTVLHAIRHGDSTWAPFYDLKTKTTLPPQVPTSAGCAFVSDQLHVLAITTGGGLWHTVMGADGAWSKFVDVRAATGTSTTTFTAVAASGLESELHVLAVTSDGAMLHAIRHADGTWVNFSNVTATTTSPGKFISVGCVTIDGEIRAIGAWSTNMVSQAIRGADGNWSPFVDLQPDSGVTSIGCAAANGDLYLQFMEDPVNMWSAIGVRPGWRPRWEIVNSTAPPGNMVSNAAAGVARPS